MAEYYPLLAKAIGSLPNSTPESRRVVYERARKALIGQLRTMHPPIPDDDIERESVALDRAVERLESELANGLAPAGAPTQAKAPESKAAETKPAEAPKAPPVPPSSADKPADKPKLPLLRPRSPAPSDPAKPAEPTPGTPSAGAVPPALRTPAPRPPALRPPLTRPPLKPAPGAPALPGAPETPGADAKPQPDTPPLAPADEAVPTPPPSDESVPPVGPSLKADDSKRLKPPQRPIAPQPPGAREPKRRLWIIPVALGVVVALVVAAAWKLRDRPETLARTKPAEQTQADTGKIAERVGEPSKTETPSESAPPAAEPKTSEEPAKSAQPAQTTAPAPNPNPELPVAHRAALLVEAPDEPNKVKTFLGTVVWKLDNAPQGANAAVGLAVQADIDLPDDKMKAVVVFEKNADASLPASHTIKVRFMAEPGSFSGNVKQISVPQMRPEASPGGETLAGVTVPITTNSFLVGLSPGNAEAANTDLIRRLQWFDIPMMLDNGKIAKLTFEKNDSGQRLINEALDAWQKQ